MDRATTEADLATLDALGGLNTELRNLLREIRLSINTISIPPEDRADVVDSFRRFVAELAKSDPDADRLMRYWRRIDELAPTTAHELARIETVQRLSLRWGEGIQPRGGYLNERAAREFVEATTDPRIRRVLEWAHYQMVWLSASEWLRPEGAFDLLYFYRVLAKWFESPHLKVEFPLDEPEA